MEWSKCNVSSSVRVRFSSACCPDSHNTTACIVFCNFTDSDRREEKPCDTGSTVPLSGSGGSGNGGGSVTSGVHHGGGGTGSSTVGLHGTGIGGHAPSASSSDGRGSGSGGTGSSANGSGGTGSSASGQNGDGTSANGPSHLSGNNTAVEQAEGGANVGVIAGAVIGVLALAGLSGFLAFFLYRRWKKKEESKVRPDENGSENVEANPNTQKSVPQPA
ncbi:lysozyme D-like isoform X1 [Ostrea edulis]|uniref:lysozyme D-like isoform X1 n=1 Tax=Ostrea edulis TaxID=37623 RepID=UPI0024AFDE60|nr:lysozyme D-like isoform X1 [Ostrea edulis]